MKKKIVMMLLGGIMAGILPADEELTVAMELISEMPALRVDGLSGKVVLVNNGREAIKLVKNTEKLPCEFVESQIRFFVDTNSVPINMQEAICGYPLHGIPYGNQSREDIKRRTEFIIDKKGDFIILPAGQSYESHFWDIEFDMLQYFPFYKRLLFKAELYVQPDLWIPIKITTPLEFACDAKIKHITPNSMLKKEKTPLLAARVSIGTNEFLYAGGKRVLDLSPDDQVEQNDNTRIIVTRKDGTKTEISTDNIDIFAKQREEKRKAKQTTGD